MSRKLIHNILDFWFNGISYTSVISSRAMAHWWITDENFDNQVKEKFSDLVHSAFRGDCDSWTNASHGSLALILLLGSFPRNIYRGTKQAYVNDIKVLNIAIKGMQLKQDLKLVPIQRAFFYLPYANSEEIEMQEHSVRYFSDLFYDSPSDQSNIFSKFLDLAHNKYEIIQKFGRFPNRNTILGRDSTKKELEYLNEHNVYS